ncbi:hypothetical protein NOR_07654 [Metarhizium rileyi]|uniref:Uncharacterized protein n=1 Tax=Metarhizium rileyi (strain RCEF 4871) TaxID=1649241 RepID=A0A166XXQ7_METRR|nr:hypothetical protein NOR_07654 [Metarhizium rileyi RCEF 4871]
MKVSRGIESKRTLNSTEEQFHAFYNLLDQQIKARSVGSSRIYNFDETGIAEEASEAGKVIGSSLISHSTKTTGSSREWASILECWTPRDSKEVRAQIGLLRRNLDGIDRGYRTLVSKAGDSLDQKNSLIAAKNNYLEAKADASKHIGRKPVKKDPNKAFALIFDIIKAKAEADHAAALYEERHGHTIEEDALEIAGTDQSDMEFTFQL